MPMPAFYFETHFRLAEAWPAQPESFAIITAFATTGERWTAAQNIAADLALETELKALATWVRRITGFSPTTSHAEPGWAVAISFAEACAIGVRYRQDAIYFVTHDTLAVSYCDSRRGLLTVGEFHSRVHQA